MIGVFDSGAGGLSVLREILKILPRERYIYFADNAFCPYGEKTPQFIQDRARFITDYLLEQGADIVVVACNTATAAAISTLRQEYSIKFIGMEPAVKPAALSSESGVIGVLATAGTLKGSKYLNTKGIYKNDARIEERVGQGFVEGADRIVLGCTHYPFLREVIQRIAGPDVEVIDPAPAVARQLLRVMTAEGIVREDALEPLPDIRLEASGDPTTSNRLLQRIISEK